MKKFFKEAKGHLMTGIGYMLPLIIGASLVVAIPKLIGVAMGINSLDIYAEKGFYTFFTVRTSWMDRNWFSQYSIGWIIAYSIADKPPLGEFNWWCFSIKYKMDS
ncbi:MAG: hypothetical protein ACLRHW_09535 [Coprobacillus cateniformis]